MLIAEYKSARSSIDHYLDDPRATRQQAGLSAPREPQDGGNGQAAGGSDKPRTCCVCWDDVVSPAFKCGHLFCVECLEGTLEVKVKEKPRGAVICPMHKCTQLVTEVGIRVQVRVRFKLRVNQDTAVPRHLD